VGVLGFGFVDTVLFDLLGRAFSFRGGSPHGCIAGATPPPGGGAGAAPRRLDGGAGCTEFEFGRAGRDGGVPAGFDPGGGGGDPGGGAEPDRAGDGG
jgi:hypothetical protein